MSALGALVSRATAFFGPDYVRDRDSRIALMESHEASSSTEPDPFREVDEEFYRLLQAEAGGWDLAADAYAAALNGRDDR